MQYSTRLQPRWNIAIPRVLINLISNKVKVQYLFYHTHYTCIQNLVRALKTEKMHSSKTTLSYVSTKKCHHDSLYLASACMCFRTMTVLVSEGLVGHCDVRLAACLQANVWPAQKTAWLAPSLSNNESGSIFRWCLNNDVAFGILPFEFMLHANNKVTRCKVNSSFRSTQHYLLKLHVF